MAQDPWAEFRVGAPAAQPTTSAPAYPGVIRGPADPYKARNQQLQEEAARRAAEANARAAEAAARSAENSAHSNATTDQKQRIGNPQDLRKEFDTLPEVKSYKVAAQQLSMAVGTGEGPQADLALTYAFAKAMDPDSVVRESEQASVAGSQAWLDAAAENVKKQFGMDGAGNYTPEARAALRQQIIRSVASRNQQYLAARQQFEELAKRNGIDPFEVVGQHDGAGYLGQMRAYDNQRRAAGANVLPVTGQQEGGGATPPAIGGDDTGPMQAATGDTRRVADPEVTAQLDRMIRKGAPLASINTFLTGKGMSPVGESEYEQVTTFLKRHPEYSGSVAKAWKLEPISGFEKTITAIGDNPIGAYFVGAGDMLSGGTLDNLAADPERARAAMDVVSSQNRTANAIGQVSGGIMGSLAGETGLARLGVAGGLGRGLAADIGMGAAYGAGTADGPNQSRGLNALAGGATAGVGNMAGNALIRGVGKAVAPTGGKLGDIYAAGVRPTPGQRFANSGPLGAALNKTEEVLQSVPVVGSAIAGARQDARDQFQIGAFNEALKEVGEQLPKGMGPGTAPHAYAQKTFDRVYAEARKGMTLVVDETLTNDIAGMADNINSLGKQDLARFKSIVENRVNNKLKDGVASGDDFKRIMSGLDEQIRALGKNPQAQELMGVLTDLKFAIEGAARRHSDPDAVALLDAADAGYAKFVRIEGAAARRGGDAGTFNPNQFDAEVQKASGGVRSKAYNRGDALMQDFAEQGKNLSDKTPNSGTADRTLTLTNLGLAALLSPVAIAYGPGRKLITGAMAPAGAKRTAISAQLKKRAALAGKASAATGVVALPGTSPGQ